MQQFAIELTAQVRRVDAAEDAVPVSIVALRAQDMRVRLLERGLPPRDRAPVRVWRATGVRSSAPSCAAGSPRSTSLRSRARCRPE